MASTAFVASPARVAGAAGKKETPLKFAAHSKNAGKVRGAAARRAVGQAIVGGPHHQRSPRPALPQMDRFIPNRSASNLDVANYNVSREARDVENLDALSPTKVSCAAGGQCARQQHAGRSI